MFYNVYISYLGRMNMLGKSKQGEYSMKVTQAELSWGSVQAEKVRLQLQAKQTTYTNQALSKSTYQNILLKGLTHLIKFFDI